MIFEDPPNKEPYSCIINSKTMVKKQNNIKFCSIPCRSKSSLFRDSSGGGSHYSSQPRLNSHLSASTSPICMTGNMQVKRNYYYNSTTVDILPLVYRAVKHQSNHFLQFQLSQKYKSSADLVSELLRKPVFTRYRSMKKKSSCYVSNPCEPPVSNNNQSVIKTHHNPHENLQHFPALQSVDLVKNCPAGSAAIQKQVSDNKSDPVEIQTVQMRLPVTMRPRLATVNSDCDEVDHGTDSSDSEHMTNINGQHGFEVKKCKSHVFNGNNTTNNSNNVTNNINNKTNISDKSTSTVATVSLLTLY